MLVFPTRNIHFVHAIPTSATNPALIPIELSMCADWPPQTLAERWTDLATLPGVIINCSAPHGNDVVDTLQTPTGMQLTPFPPAMIGPGANFYQLSARVPHAATTLTLETVIRVAVHTDVTRLFLPYGNIFMLTGRDDFVLTVFALFDDGETWDVTEHPWLELDSEDRAIATIDATGRITGVAPGNTFVWVQPRGRAAARQRCMVTVQTVAQRQGAGDIYIRNHSRPADATGRIFIVSDGYVEKDRFVKHATEVNDRIWAEANAPFRWLKHRLAVTSVYVRSAGTRGITLGPPIGLHDNQIVMSPRGGIRLDGTPQYDAARLNAFGCMYGERIGDPRAPTAIDTRTPDATLLSFQGATEVRSLSIDIRRIGARRDAVGIVDPRVAFLRRFRELFTELGLTLRPTDRVVFLVDDQLRGGARLAMGGEEPADNQFVAISIGADGAGFDGVTPHAGNPLVTRVSIRDHYHRDYTADSLVHEIAHTYGLGDEYEPRREVFEASEGNRHVIEQYDNLVLLPDVLVGTVSAKLEAIKWHVPRVAKASLVTHVERFQPGSALIVDIDGNAEKRWKRDEVVRLRTSYATPRRRNPDGTVDVHRARIRDFGYQVMTVQGSRLTLFSTDVGPRDDDLDQLRVLYAPIPTATGDILRLIDPLVERDLAANGVFPKPAGRPCDSTADGVHNEPVAPRAIAGLVMPTYPADLIGLYEGGNGWACGVVRPAGRCKMRRTAETENNIFTVGIELCFVCKFIITDRIDPTKLDKVQVHYPVDC